MNNKQDDLVQNYSALKKKPNSEQALHLLKRLASQVKPILNNRNWKIKNLCEFFPTNPNLLGVNVNRGWKINLRLRPHFDETQFLEYEEILGTLLHEMAHIVRGPHDKKFYKLLEELKAEIEVFMASGYKGEGFYSDGHALGSRSVPRYLSNKVAALAAEKRLQTSKIMLPSGGVRLGGGSASSSLLKNMTPAQLAASAAEKRLRDKVWCGGSIENEGASPVSSSASSSTVSSPVPATTTKIKFASNSSSSSSNHNNNATSPIMNHGKTTPSVKKAHVTIDLTDDDDNIESLTIDNDDDDNWTCPTCTFINKPLVLACQICTSERPPVDDDNTPLVDNIYWKCPQCTLLNEKKWQACIACAYVNLQ